MEYAICRAMEICRLDLSQIFRLQEAENSKARCFMPSEIQSLFNLPELKIVYEVPETDTAQSAHNQRIKNEFYQHKIYPEFFYLQSTNPEEAHRFDGIVRKLVVDDMVFELRYMGREKIGGLK